jgi:hypothetical protein
MAHGKTLVLKKGSLCQDSARLSTWVPIKQTNKQTNKQKLWEFLSNCGLVWECPFKVPHQFAFGSAQVPSGTPC